MRVHIEGINITGQDTETPLPLAETLHDLLDTTADPFGRGGLFDELVAFFRRFLVGQWLGNNIDGLDAFFVRL